ncbi:MAG: TerB N-terminal domain-containing protein, partial [Eubacterium sp.]|nr:TerB N-terminal domain-containing protein [Eubacterium sp.]
MMFAGHSDDTEKNRKKFTIVLEKKAEKDDHVFRDTALPFANSVTRKCTTSNAEKRDFPDHDTVRESSSDGNAVKEGSADGNAAGESSSDGNAARICSAGNTTMTGNICPKPDIPQKILAMARLYEYGDGSLLNKAQNLYRQGKFMEDYEDHVPWNGTIHRYFTTYHDLNLRQLRGYFTWRTEVRKGRYKPIATSLAYLYIYELLCG